MATEAIDDELRMLEFKLAQLKRDYDQYFLGSRPREPVQLRGEINKAVVELTNTAIKNTASRFKFSSICSRYQAFRRQWDETLRKIEAGTYERHRFKAKLHEQRDRAETPAAGARGRCARARGGRRPLRGLRRARRSCGESVKGLTREKLDGDPRAAARGAAREVRRGHRVPLPGPDRERQDAAQGVAREGQGRSRRLEHRARALGELRLERRARHRELLAQLALRSSRRVDAA